MSDSTKSSEDGISARISDGDVGKFAGNNIASSRSGIRATDEVVAEETTKPSNMTRTSEPSGSSMHRKEPRAKVVTYSQEDSDALEELSKVPLKLLTGRQQESLNGAFYRKYSDKNVTYMNRTERLIHAHFETICKEEDFTELSLEPPVRSTTPGWTEDSFSKGFTPIHQPQRKGSEGRQSLERSNESVTTVKYVPTTKDVLDTFDQVKRRREGFLSTESFSGSDRASPRPETHSPLLGKRTRVESPTRGHIITSVAASDFKPLDDEITPEMAINFERQVGRLPTGTTVANCVVGKAFTSLDTRLRTDRDQDFIKKADLDNWKNVVSLDTLSRMVMKYHGPQSEAGGTIEQAVRALPFEFNYTNDKVLIDTIHEHVVLIDTYTRRFGTLTPETQIALTKRMIQNSALYQDYKDARAVDAAVKGFEDTWLAALRRWAAVIQNVKEIASILSNYGSLTDTRTHLYRNDASAEEVGLEGLRSTTDRAASSKVANKSAMRTTSTSFSAPESSTGQKLVALDKPIAKRAQDIDATEGHGVFITGTATCHRCGHTGHRAENCPFLLSQDTNSRTERTWSESLIGQMWKKCGHDCFDPSKTLPDTYRARNERNQESNTKDNNNNNNNNNDNRGNNDSRGGYDNNRNNNKKPSQKQLYNNNGDGNYNTGERNHYGNNNQPRCKVSHHVLAALNNATPIPDFMPAQLLLHQQMSRRGATTMAKDPIEAPASSVLAQVLLDSGSLAGDFISRDMLLRLQGERHVYKTAQPLKVCSGMDGTCVMHHEILDIGMVFKLHTGMNKLIRLSVRINTSSSCDLIIGRASLRKHNLYRFIPGVFGEHDTDPEIPFDELRWVNELKKRIGLVTTTDSTITASIHTLTPGEGEVITDQPVQTTGGEPSLSQTVGIVTTSLTLAPEGAGDPPTRTVSQTGSSVGNQASCVCQGLHCLANCVPIAAKRPKTSVTNKQRKRQAAKARATAQAVDVQHDPVIMAALTEQATDEDLSPMTWNPSRVVLAEDGIDNDKTDTFAPFMTTSSPKPAASFLHEITFGGDASLQKGLRALCAEYADIFSDTLPKKAADLKPF